MYESYRTTRANNYFSSSSPSGSSSSSSMSTSGACLEEALERYRRYEQRLNDAVRPNDDTVKKLNSASPLVVHNSYQQHQQRHHQQMRTSNFQAFPNGGGAPATTVTAATNGPNQSFEDGPNSDASTNNGKPPRKSKSRAATNGSNRHLPAINRSASGKSNSRSTKRNGFKGNYYFKLKFIKIFQIINCDFKYRSKNR